MGCSAIFAAGNLASIPDLFEDERLNLKNSISTNELSLLKLMFDCVEEVPVVNAVLQTTVVVQ